jgi:hypothetical protein
MFEPVYIILACVIILFYTLFSYAFKSLSRGWSFQLLFKDFNRKIWMTLCLGVFFFGLFLVTVSLGTYAFPKWGPILLLLAYRNPVRYVYGALCLFAFLSLSIYLARMVIKYFYLTRGKDN